MAPANSQAVTTICGRLFMVGLPGPVLDDSTVRLIEKHRINNFIYFKRNAESPKQLQKLSAELKRACRNNGLPSPLIAIDQEGGSVTRLGPPFTQFPDARLLAESAEPEKAVHEYAAVCAEELNGIGVNYNLAPVLDVCPRNRGFFMEKRALGSDPQTVGRLGRIIISELQAKGIAACAKHFPGLGAAVVDPHLHLPTVTKKKTAIRAEDLLPFAEAITAGVASIMTSHTLYSDLDTDKPATLSKNILTGLLRQELGYEKVIITDDLEMGAIEKVGDVGHAAAEAFEAGADLLLICHSHEKVIDALEKITALFVDDPDLAARGKLSFQRVTAMQHRFAGNN
jgi:beta-N-acetylhexosaminidase